MRKIRSKLKRKSTNLKWKKGQSSTSNPTKSLHRDKAKARLFNVATGNGLTEDAVQKLNKLQGGKGPLMVAVPKSVDESMDDESETVYSGVTTTVASFMSQFSTHTNASFNKLLNCENLNDRRREMVAVLAASTETIKEQNGNENSTEYFLAFINSLAMLEDVERADPIVGLMAMLVKSVSKAVLQDKFTVSRGVFLKLLESFDQSGRQSALIDVISCVAALLAAQEQGKWSSHAVTSLLKALLSFATHAKPKIRKAAVRSIGWLAKNVPSPDSEHHPCSKKISEYCLEYFNVTQLDRHAVSVLHILGLVEAILGSLHANDVKVVCEGLLSLSTASNVLVRMHCYEALYTLFDSETSQLSDVLAGKVIAAIFDLQPDLTDVRQSVAWVTVLKKGYSFMAKKNPKLCADMLPRFMQICVEELWPKDQGELNATITNVVREMLLDVIARLREDHQGSVSQVIVCLTSALKNPFSHCQKQVIIIFATVYEILGGLYGPQLSDSLKVLANRYDPNGDGRREIENTVMSAIKYVDVEVLLTAIPLTDPKGDISIERSWMLPLLREGLRKTSLGYFHSTIIPLASKCLQKWKSFEAAGKTNDAHIYELLCCQLWGLFPGFCRQPKDPEKFALIARTVGSILSENLYLRAPILDGFKELIPSLIAEDKGSVVGKFSKNYLPILFNLYITKAKGSYEHDLRAHILDVIKLFLKVTQVGVLNEMFATSLQRLKDTKQGDFNYNMIYDIVECFSVHLRVDQLTTLYEDYVKPILDADSKETKLGTETKKAYRIISNILGSQNEDCLKFIETKLEDIAGLVLKAEPVNADNIMFIRLKCLQKVLERKQPDLDSDLMRQCISETVLCFPNQPEKPNALCTEMTKTIGNLFLQAGRLEEFVDLVLLGITCEGDLVVKTVWALNSVLTYFSSSLNEDTVSFVLENLFASVVSNQRMEAKAALCTLFTFAKFSPRPTLTANLEALVKHLSKMVPDCKRFCRIAYGRILRKLCQYYSALEIIRLVPGNDLVTHKRLKKIRKELNRTKNLQKSDKHDSDDDDAMEIDKKLKSITINDVLKDSESEFSDSEEEEEPRKTKKGEKLEVQIHEDAESIVDLADANAVSKITTKSKKKRQRPESRDLEDDIKFKTAQDGRLIIEEPKKKWEFRAPLPKPGSKRAHDDSESDSGDEQDDAKSQKSTGHKNKKRMGIHRTTGSGMSVASGKSGKSWKSVQSAKSSKKAEGAAKKKGRKNAVQPYSYTPLRPQKGGGKKRR